MARSSHPAASPLPLLCAGLLGLVLGAPALVSTDVAAASYDPALTWRTLSTPHFNIHFHGGEEQLAEEMSALAEPIWEEMTAELQWEPRRAIELVLVDNTDSANGYAMTLPVNTIVIFVTAPTEDGTLSDYEDWHDLILTHELTHILHIDHVGGLPKALRGVFGRIVSMNRLSPGWITEGFATFQETRHTSTGRGRAAQAHMIKRMAVLEDDFPPLGNLNGFQVTPPGGNLRYLFGQDFQSWVAETYGADVWTRFVHQYGRWTLPWVLPGKRTFGKGLPALYKEWKAAMTARYEAQAEAVRAQGLTEFELLSDGEDQCAAPTYSPDGGRLVWSCNDLQEGPAIWLADGNGDNAIKKLDQRYANDFGWRQDGEALAFSALHVVDRFNIYSDVYYYELTGRFEALTNGDRARNPAFSPDGRELLVVTNDVQNNQLKRVTIDQQVEPLYAPTDHTQLSTPRWSPDGRHLAMSVWQEGRRDIWIFDADGTPVRRVTADEALDLDPAWSADGKTLYFSSDRTGIYNIYAVDLETEALFQVTNVLGGAFAPSVKADGTSLVFESYSANGMDVARMDLDRSQWRPVGLVPRPLGEARLALGSVAPSVDFAPITPSAPVPPSDAEEVEAPDLGRKGRIRRDDVQAPLVPLTDGLHVPGLSGLGGSMAALPAGTPHPLFGEAPRDPGLPAGGTADAPDAGVGVDDPTRTGNRERKEEDYPFTYPVKRYSPWPTLAPRYLVPTLSLTQYNALQGGLAIGGSDTLNRFLYSASMSYRTDAGFLGWGVGFTYNQLVPVFSVGAYTAAIPLSTISDTTAPPAEGGTWVPSTFTVPGKVFWEQRTTIYGSVAFPINQYQALFATWRGELRDDLRPLEGTEFLRSPQTQGFLSSVGGGWSMSRGRFFNTSVSPEQARTLAFMGELAHPYLGSRTRDYASVADEDAELSGFTRLQLTGEWKEYRSLPWADNHVAAFRVAGGASFGDALSQGSFRLGGSIGDSSAYTLPTEYRTLRGFPFGSAFGDSFYLGSAEYRLPLWWIDRGLGLIPAYTRVLHGAVYVDAGSAADSFSDPELVPGTLIGTGAELRASFILGWAVPVSVRVGYGFALRGDQGYAFGDPGGLYAWLGGTF
jgi:hypothetical protein